MKQNFEARVVEMINATPENQMIDGDSDEFNNFIMIIKEAIHFGAFSENAKERILKEDRFFSVSGDCDVLESLEAETALEEIDSNAVLQILRDIEETINNPFGA